jgi:CRISPR-associated protein Csm1
MSKEEKILLLGALFHDIGKFQQRCEDVRRVHEELGGLLFEELKEYLLPIFDSDQEAFNDAKKIILNHHTGQETNFVKIIKSADHLSASERIKKEEPEAGTSQWEHKLLASVFSKVKLNADEYPEPLFFEQRLFIEGKYDAIIPEVTENSAKSKKDFGYNIKTFQDFKNDLIEILKFNREANDFNTLINLLLVLFEKYLWCVPDFTGNKLTDISLFNHIKDVAGISHAIYKSKPDSKNLNLIIGDIPGIQKYIFDITNQRPAKILRGRSIFVQILARQLATKMLSAFDLTDCNLIMLAGGKFYILAPDITDFEKLFNATIVNIEKEMALEFNYELKFAAGSCFFNYEQLMKKETSFGEIIYNATVALERNRYKPWQAIFDFDNFNEGNNIFNIGFTEKENSELMKCKVTEKPMMFDRVRELKKYDEDEADIFVDKQVELEFNIGSKIPKENAFFLFNKEEKERVLSLKELIKNKKIKNEKLLLNARLRPLLDEKNIEYLQDTTFLEVASFVSVDNKDKVIPFDEIAKKSSGAEYLTLIKGDIDNLGILMAQGLSEDDKDKNFTSISRTTTMSNQLKYFFSYFLNGFLDDWCKQHSTYVYTVFAGGDDLMIIAPHSEALPLLKSLNDKFKQFVCANTEIHISFSLTNFKPGTPIRIVSEFADENQSTVKHFFKNTKDKSINEIIDNPNAFTMEKDKAGTLIFNTAVKNTKLEDLNLLVETLKEWIKPADENLKPKLSMGMLRNLMILSDIMREYRSKGRTTDLLWHPKLTYQVNRLLKKNGKYIDEDVGKFFEKILLINKNQEEVEFENLLYPAVSTVTYLIRQKSIGG